MKLLGGKYRLIELDIKKFGVAQAKACLYLNELSEKSGVTREGISKLIHGKRNATPKTIGLLAKALNVDVTEIIVNQE